MERVMKAVLTLFACAILAVPTVASAQTPSAPASLDRVPTPAPAPAITRIPEYSWTGFYGGGTLGYGGSLSDTSFVPLPSEAQFGIRSMTLNPEPMGWTFGFHGGFNKPSGKLVYGFEADYAWSSIGGNTSAAPILYNGEQWDGGTWYVQQDLEWMFTARGRLGFTLANKYMVYGTGGVALGGVNSFAEADLFSEDVWFPATDDTTRTGWTAGAGIEGALTERLAWRAQYLYVAFGSNTVTSDMNPTPFPPYQMQFEFNNTTNSFTFGVSYRF